MSTATATEQDIQQELRAKMAGKTKAEQAEILRSYMKDEGIEVQDQPKVFLTDEQIRSIVDGSTDAAKRAAAEAAEAVEKRYDVTKSEARAIADQEVSKTITRQLHKHRDFEECAKVMRALTRVATGRANYGELETAYAAEADYLQKTGREARAMSLTTDTSGGYLGGELFETMLYENISRHSFARKYCTIITMTKEILRIPKLTATLTAEQTAEASTITSSEPTFDQFVLNTKKINVLTKPFSVELFETADPALVPALIEWATREIKKKEDSLVFGTSSPGLLSHSTNKVTLGSGDTALDKVDFDDMVNMIYELDPHYIPDEDIQGSSLFSSGAARFWLPQALVKNLAKVKGNDNYHWTNVQELKHNKNIHGYDVKRVPSISSSPSAGDNVAVFGDLGYMVCGVRPGFRIELQSQGTVDSVNLNETNSYAVRVTEFFDNDSIDDEAFSILELAEN